MRNLAEGSAPGPERVEDVTEQFRKGRVSFRNYLDKLKKQGGVQVALNVPLGEAIAAFSEEEWYQILYSYSFLEITFQATQQEAQQYRDLLSTPKIQLELME